jgi:hypothetical protein
MMALDGIFVALWRHRTTLEGIERFGKLLTAGGVRQPAGLGILTIVPAKAPPPAFELRGRLAQVFADATHVKGSAVCFEGTGLRATMVRSVVTGITILSPPAFPQKVFSELSTALDFLNQRLSAVGAPVRQTSANVAEIESWRRGLDG